MNRPITVCEDEIVEENPQPLDSSVLESSAKDPLSGAKPPKKKNHLPERTATLTDVNTNMALEKGLTNKKLSLNMDDRPAEDMVQRAISESGQVRQESKEEIKNADSILNM